MGCVASKRADPSVADDCKMEMVKLTGYRRIGETGGVCHDYGNVGVSLLSDQFSEKMKGNQALASNSVLLFVAFFASDDKHYP